MPFRDRLRALDQRLPGTRNPDEPAEVFLRRVAAGRVISPAQSPDVLEALRELLAEADEQLGEDDGGENGGADEKADDEDDDDE